MLTTPEIWNGFRYLLTPTPASILNAPRPEFYGLKERLFFTIGKATFPRLSSHRILGILLIILGYLLMNMTFSCWAATVGSAEKSRIPTIGTGPYKLYIFTDYFCGPCQALEAELDSMLQELIERNSVKITFVDLPIHRGTVLFNRYYLYAAHTAGSGRDLLRIRRELFALAGLQPPADEKKIISRFENRNIAFQVYELKPVYRELNRIIKEFNIHSTPTCVVQYSSTDIRTYSGIAQIRQGMNVLLAATARSK
ncbi:hypothetical protein SAMN04489760_1139 [Syntrophus gentianae]|uniref:Thioredoxin n=1 Tax=Syntrophus gentianae TaxID=43775 RepID=A0A1H7Y0C9_9BACT|nr:hypothetical protein SAMN04489760_1139 [Syntrophus gentianae]